MLIILHFQIFGVKMYIIAILFKYKVANFVSHKPHAALFAL